MKKKELIKRIDLLEKIVKSNGITFTDPSDENKQVFVGIKDGKFTQDVITKTPETENRTNITNQPI